MCGKLGFVTQRAVSIILFKKDFPKKNNKVSFVTKQQEWCINQSLSPCTLFEMEAVKQKKTRNMSNVV